MHVNVFEISNENGRLVQKQSNTAALNANELFAAMKSKGVIMKPMSRKEADQKAYAIAGFLFVRQLFFG